MHNNALLAGHCLFFFKEKQWIRKLNKQRREKLQLQRFKFSFVALFWFKPQKILCKLWNLLVKGKLFKDIAVCSKYYIGKSFDIYYK